MEGTILQRITKKEQAARNKYSINWFNIGELKLLVNLGATADNIPAKISVNLAINKCWKLVTDKPGKNIAQLLSSMDREGRAFHLDADDVVPVDDHKDNVEEDQEEAGAVNRFHQDNTSTTNHEVATTECLLNNFNVFCLCKTKIMIQSN